LIQESNEEKDKQLKNLAQESIKTKTNFDITRVHVERMNGVMAITTELIHQTDRSSALQSLGDGLIENLKLDSVLIAESRLDGPHLLEVFGDAPPKYNLDSLLGQRNPIIDCINTDNNILVADISEHENWINSPLIKSLSAGGFIALTISPRTDRTIVALGLNKSPLERFSKNEEELFHLFSRQIANIIQNIKTKVIAETKLREVNLLLDFSQILENLDSSSILEKMVNNILKVIPGASGVMAALWDPFDKCLIPQAASGYTNNNALLKMCIQKDEAILGRVFESGESLCIDDVNFTVDYDFSKDNLLHYKDATHGSVPIATLCVPIQSNNDKNLGVILVDNHHISRAFPPEDQVTINSIAQLTALMLDYENAYKTTHQRAHQLQVLTDLSATISASLHPDELIQSLLDKLEVILPFHTGTLWMIEGNYLTIKATLGFDEDEYLIGITTRVEDSELMRLMINSSTGMFIGDMASDPRFPSLDQRVCHSWLGVPMISKDEVIGVIALEHRQRYFYSKEHLQLASLFAGQAAIAVENARLYQSSQLNAQELDQRSKNLKRIYNFSKDISSSLNLRRILQITLSELDKSVTADTISIVFLEELENSKSSKTNLNLIAERPAIEGELPLTIPYAPIFDHLEESLGIFITSDISTEENLTALDEYFTSRSTQALLILPLVTGNVLFGFILIQTKNNHDFTTNELESARVITNHSTIAIQNALEHEKTSRLKEQLEDRINERTRQLRLEHQRAQALLRIMKELSTSLNVDQVLSRTLALLNETVGAELSSILLSQPDGNTFIHRAILNGDNFHSHTEENEKQYRRDEALAKWAISNRRGDTISNLKQDPRWKNLINQDNDFHSAVVVPLVVRDETLGTLQLYHRQDNWFTQDHFEFVQGAANQIAISVNNATLFNLIREQAEELGTSLRNQQVEAGRSRAILEAVADGVIVTDADGEITLFNGSAERILGLDASQALGKSLELFIGLFSSASSTWIQTIRSWSDDPSSYQSKETYEEHINLDNDHVVAIHLAPVIIDNEFFGTVSIFRDITHLVEVDRLKSDFVAQVSHELRTPMTSIKGYVDLILMGATGELSEQQDDFLQIVKSNTQRLNVLVNDLLDISRIETGRVAISMQALNLLDIAEGVATNIRKRCREDDKQMGVKVDIPHNLSPVFGDRELIHQIFNNLITNAYNYTPSGGRIEISARENHEHVQVNIQDNGIGIPVDEQANVFERFYRGENPLILETAGTGLGLSIAKRLVELHKGKIWLESSGIPGKGCTFSFTLPFFGQLNEESEN
jgi:PAS domain S-box-containing protein